MWKDPNSVERPVVVQQPLKMEGHHPKYHNPFELKQPKDGLSIKVDNKQAPRKRWGDQQSHSETPLGEDNKMKKRNEEDDYSDSFEDLNQDADSLEEVPQQRRVYNERDDLEVSKEENDIEQFLRTATEQDISNLKISLSNFGKVAKNQKKQGDEEDYIQEEFEELINSDNDDADSDNSDKVRQLELQRKLILQQQQVLISKNVTMTARNAKNRPISATFNLEATKVNKKHVDKAQQSSNNPYDSSTAGYSNINSFAGSQLSAQLQPSYSMLSVRDKQPPSKLPSSFMSILETPKQPNDFMKKPINTNPFKRPFSQNIPKRQDMPKPVPTTTRVRSPVGIPEVEEEEVKKQSPMQKGDYMQRIPINEILSKIEKLDDWQKEKLFQMLDNFDSSALEVKSIQKQSNEKLMDFQFLSPYSVQQQSTNKISKVQPVVRNNGLSIPIGKQEIIIRIIKTYGNPHVCGLTEIEVFDHQCQKLILAPANIIVRNLGQGPKNSLTKLLDGHKLTNEERHMWIGYLPIPPKHLEIVIIVNKDIVVGGLKIWNYNKSAIDCTKGIKEIQILSSQAGAAKDIQQIIWSGVLERGRGQVNSEYATFIKLQEGIELPKEVIKKPEVLVKAEETVDTGREEVKAGNNNNEMKKYQSQAVLAQKTDSTPIWLASDRGNSKVQASQALIKEPAEVKPVTTRKILEDNKAGANTFDLLGKNSAAQQQPNRGMSSNQSQRPHPYREQQSVKNLQISSGTEAAPKLLLPSTESTTSAASYIKQNKFDSALVDSQQKQNQRQQLQETSDAIKQAVSKVNMLTGIVRNQIEPEVKKAQMEIDVDESLDNLDLFKATNLGRLWQKQSEVGEQSEEVGMKTLDKKQVARTLWDMSPSQRTLESQLSASGRKGAHVLVKNPFPDSLQVSKKQAINTDQAVNPKQQIIFDDDNDILDQFMNIGVPKSTTNLKKDQKSERIVQVPVKNYEVESIKEPIKKISEQVKVVEQPVERSFDDKLKLFNDDFKIPNLPSGQKLHFNILSTWGDMNYVGLTGIEIFDVEGQPVKIDESRISACPPDINILPGYGGDPRTVDKLVDGHYYTNDDLHVWLTPFTAGEDHTIMIDLAKKTQISMIRIWNYNKSRIHAYRGARLIMCELDGKSIFRGEIQKAPGNLNDPENCCEIILFTENESIMEKIDQNDWINDQLVQNTLEDTQRVMQEVPSFFDERPMTATKKFNTAEIEEIQRQLRQQKPTSLFDERPQTSAIIDQHDQKSGRAVVPQPMSQKNQNELSSMVKQLAQIQTKGLKGRVLEFNITETWGDLFYVGLTGIEVLDTDGRVIPILNVEANPKDMNQIAGHGSDYRTLDKLFDKENNTTDDHHMWLIPFNKGEKHSIRIDFGKQQTISAIRLFNYNKSEEDTLRGAKQIVMWLDKKYITPRKGITVRKAPGFTHPRFSMGQEIQLPITCGWSADQIIPLQKPLGELYLFQEYELVTLPIGFIFKLNLYSTHGDFYYIGLNGIELFDQNGFIIKVSHIIAQPQGVHQVPKMENDVRVISNLINGKNQTYEEQNMWLAPFKNTLSYSAVSNSASNPNQVAQSESNDHRVPNYICIVFDEPKAISAIRIWNYSKTPSRGVNEFELLIDDKQIYRGFAKAAPEKCDYDKSSNKDFSTVVLFTSEDKIVEKFKNNLSYDPSKQQIVMLINEKKVMNQSKRPEEEFFGVYNDTERPTTMAHKKQY